MHKFEWTPNISVNDEHIDNQHKTIFHLMDQFYQAVLAGKDRQIIGSTLDALSAYTRTHFAEEETLMMRVGYPGTEAHRSKHRELISEVERLTTLFHQANDLKTIDLLVVMFDWIIDHIKQADQEFKPFV